MQECQRIVKHRECHWCGSIVNIVPFKKEEDVVLENKFDLQCYSKKLLSATLSFLTSRTRCDLDTDSMLSNIATASHCVSQMPEFLAALEVCPVRARRWCLESCVPNRMRR